MRLFKWTGGIVGALLLVLVAWGLVEPNFIDRERYEVEVPGLPEAWQGKAVAQISDWQVGMWLDNEPTIRRVVRRILEEEPALVLITGDFIYKPEDVPHSELQMVETLLRPLGESDIPVFAVLGNHDYGVSEPGAPPKEELAQAVRRTLRRSGVEVLENDAIPLPAPGASDDAQPLHLVGVGPHWPGRDRPSEALAGVPDGAPRLVMMHNPNTFAKIPAHAAPLAVAGHTHGGQVRIPYTPSWSWLTYAKADLVHADGWIDGNYGEAGNRLYVNRGIGFGLLPLRINCMPELTLFTLQRSQGDAAP